MRAGPGEGGAIEMRLRAGRAVGVAAAAALTLAAAACREGGESARVSLAERVKLVQGSSRAEGVALRCAVGAMLTPAEGLAQYGALLTHVGAAVGRPVAIVDRPSYAAITGDLEQGAIDVAFVCSGPYVEGRRRFGLELLAVPVVGGKTTYQSYVIAGSALAVRGFEDLRGRSFAFTDPDSNTGRLVPLHVLGTLGERPETFFSRTLFSGSHDRSIEAVAGRVVDAAAVDSLIWDHAVRDHPDTARLVRVVWSSEPYGIPPVVARPGLPAELRERLRAAFLALHEDPEARPLLGRLGIERFVAGRDADYDSIRAMQARLAAAGGGGP